MDFNFLMSQQAPKRWTLNSWAVQANHAHPNGGTIQLNTNAAVTTPENHEFDLAPRLLDDPDGIVYVSRRLAVDGEDFVILPHPEPLGLAPRDHPGHENPGVLLLILVQSPAGESQV